MLDNTRLRGELSHIHRALSAAAASTRGKEMVEHLRRAVDATTAALLWQSLFADCLRVAYTAAAADGEIGDDEIAALYEFVFSVARHYAGVMPYYRDFSAVDEESIREFLKAYATDSGPFGERATLHWPGLTLCRKAANDLGESDALERYERMMSWFIPAACEIGGVTESDPRWSGRVAELHGLRRTLANTAAAAAAGKAAMDARLKAFLATKGVFASVQPAHAVFEADPFDVESIHQDARVSFEQMVDRAIEPKNLIHGQILLVLGESGAGKTHLLRGYRRYVHDYGRGFVAYAQMNSAAPNYARYLLNHVVDSLARPYTGPSGDQTGLFELASGLTRLADEPLQRRIMSLVTEDWPPKVRVSDYVEDLVGDLLKNAEVSRAIEPDLLRVLLYALIPNTNITSRVYRYLRCEDMSQRDREWLGDVVPRTRDEQPLEMIRAIARVAFLTRRAALVLMLDQAELSLYDPETSYKMFARAVDTLYSIVSEVPSAVAVVACLTDLYDAVRGHLSRPMLDRLEKDPPFERLHLNRSYTEIEAIVGHRLSWLYAQTGVAYRPDEPVYPIPSEVLRNLVNLRTRDVLQRCHDFQLQCIAARKIVDVQDISSQSGVILIPPAALDSDLLQIEAAWNDASHASDVEVPEGAEQVLAALKTAAKACADEVGLKCSAQLTKSGMLKLQLNAKSEHADLVLALTNNGFQRGAFGAQLEDLRRAAGAATPIAVRTLDFPRGPASNEAVARLVKGGGRKALMDSSTLRTLAAFQKFQTAYPEKRILAWQRRYRPISGLLPLASLFELERLVGNELERTNADAEKPSTKTPPSGTPVVAAAQAADAAKVGAKRAGKGGKYAKPEAVGRSSPNSSDSARDKPLLIGTAASFSAESKTLPLSALLRHAGILGSTGSGKTTLALNLIEQLLERDVAVVLVDRKGDLAGYAQPDWWQGTSDPVRARALAEHVDLRLFTPGTGGGRPLALPVVPELAAIPEHERDRMVQFTANALAALMDNGISALRAILMQAIAVLAERKQPSTLTTLLDLIESRDDQLLVRAGRYEDKLFKKLVQELETVRIRDGHLFDPKAELLTAELLLGRKPDGKVPLTIVSTRFLGEVDQVQAWAAHLIACLSRYAARCPSSTLQAVVMFDEADIFMPAGSSKPPSKEPLQDLLKRARAAGLGVILASQSPGDIDYRSREQINTWFLGRITDQNSIAKMKPLFERKPTVAGKLALQDGGRFVLLQDGEASDIDRTPSLLRTEPVPETELTALAARNRAGG